MVLGGKNSLTGKLMLLNSSQGSSLAEQLQPQPVQSFSGMQ